VRTLAALYALMRADYLERVRRHAFLVTLLVTIYFAYLFLPPNDARYVTFQVAETRGIYNSAWVGGVVAMMTSTFLSLAGFYVVKNAVERDRRTGVGQILASTPLPKSLYTLGKAASNFAVLATMVAVIAAMSAVMQIARGEDRHIDAMALLAPFVWVTLPGMAVVAALAVAFETIPFLAGGFGNIAYIFTAMSALWAPAIRGPEHRLVFGDALGLGALLPEMTAAAGRAFPDIAGRTGSYTLGFNISETARHLRSFEWSGLTWTAGVIGARLMSLPLAGLIAIASAIPFDRFDSTRPVRDRRRRGAAAPEAERSAVAAAPLAPPRELTAPVRAFGFGSLLRAEVDLTLKGVPWPGLAVAAGLAIAGVLAPLAVGRGILLPASWVWPVLLWSAMGAREQRHGVAPLLHSSPHPLARQLFATWLVGVLLALATGSGVGARLVLAGEWPGVATWIAAALFIPSLALASGVWTGGGKLFEVLYTMLWYGGPVNRIRPIDFIGTSPENAASGAWGGFALAAVALLAVALLALAVLGRRRQLRS